MNYWPAIIFGWPTVILGGVLLIAGIVRQNSSLSLFGAILVSLFCGYLALMPPPFRWLALAALAGITGSYFAVKRQASVVASLLLVPFFALIFITAYAVLNEGR